MNTHVTRLETAMVLLAEAQLKTEEQFQRTDARSAQLRLESNERERHMDERIEKLVSAIGELITRMPPAIAT